MEKLKIIFTQDALVNAGAERSHLEILSRFSPDVEVLMVYFYPNHDLKEEYQYAGICLHFLDIPESYSFGTAISRLVRLIRKEKPDLLVSSLYRADIITRFAALITGVPLVGTLVNDSYGPFARNEKPGLKYRLVYLLDRWTSGIPIHWIANAKSLVDSHVKTLGLKKEKISVVYRGRPVPRPRPVSPRSVSSQTETNSFPRSVSSQTETSLSSPTGINNDEIMDCEDLPTGQAGTVHGEEEKKMSCEDTVHGDKIMSCEDTGHGIIGHGIVVSNPRPVSPQAGINPPQAGINPVPSQDFNHFTIRNFISYGRLLERKGFQELILAFSEVLKYYPDCTLTIYGEGAFRKNLEVLVNSLKLQTNVKLPGRVTDPTDLLTASTELSTGTEHCFIFPSWYEGFSGALVEAMMAGIPIIASDIPMNLEAVTADINALTFPVKDVEALVQKMLFAIENPDKMAELGKAARLEAIERFDIEKIAKEYEGVLHLTQKKPHPSPLPDTLLFSGQALKERERFSDGNEK